MRSQANRSFQLQALSRLVALSSLLLAGCAAGSAAPSASARVVPLDEEATLSVGELVEVAGTETSVRFAGVVEDSRCPAGVTCVWAGRARVRLEVARRGGGRSEVELSSQEDEATRRSGGLELTMVGLEPAPAKGTTIRSEDYRLRLVIRRLGSG